MSSSPCTCELVEGYGLALCKVCEAEHWCVMYPYTQPVSPPSVYELFHQMVAARRAEPAPKRVKFVAPATELLPEQEPQADLPCEELSEYQLALSYGICLAGGACDSEDDPDALCAVCAEWSQDIQVAVPGIPQAQIVRDYDPDFWDLVWSHGVAVGLHQFITQKVDEEYAVTATILELQRSKQFPLGLAEVTRYKRPGSSKPFFKFSFKEGSKTGPVFPEKIPGLWESPAAKEERRQRFLRCCAFEHRAFVRRWEQQQIVMDPDYLFLQKWRVRWRDYNWSRSANPHPTPLEAWPVAQREFAFDDWLLANPPYIGWEGEAQQDWISPYRENFRFNLGWAKFEPGCPTCPKDKLPLEKLVFIFFSVEEDKWRIPKADEADHMFGPSAAKTVVFEPVKDKKQFVKHTAAFWWEVQALSSEVEAARVLLPKAVFDFRFKRVRRHLPGKPCR